MDEFDVVLIGHLTYRLGERGRALTLLVRVDVELRVEFLGSLFFADGFNMNRVLVDDVQRCLLWFGHFSASTSPHLTGN